MIVKIHLACNLTVQFKVSKYYSIDYKMAGQQVLVKETADGLELLIYAQGQLIQRIPKKT